MNKQRITKLPEEEKKSGLRPRLRSRPGEGAVTPERPPSEHLWHGMGCPLQPFCCPSGPPMYPLGILPPFPFQPPDLLPSSEHPNNQLQEPLKLPLPPSHFEDEPRYVNAKQYLRIIKMREKRQQRPERPRAIKKYRHESRHEHAKRRKRCKNGRFVSQKGSEGEEKKTEGGCNRTEAREAEEDVLCAGRDNSEVMDSMAEIQKTKYNLAD